MAKWALVFTFSLILSGCSTMNYMLQASLGQMELWNKSRTLEETQEHPFVEPRVKRLLGRVHYFKAYGEKKGLKSTTNYSDYVKLERDSVVWVVSACEALSFKPKQWSFPVVGSFTYKGWFHEEDAKSYGEELRKEGWDVDVRGAGAYSTLGWFRDPILSTMIRKGERAYGQLANTILHESVHATLYINGQSYFNESLASFVADRMVWGLLKEDPEITPEEVAAYRKSRARQEEVGQAFRSAYGELERLYGSSKSDSEKLKQKAKIFEDLKSKTRIKRELSNASLVQYRTYGVGEGGFVRLFDRCEKDWGRFLGALSQLNEESFPQAQLEGFEPVLDQLSCSS